MGKRIRKRFALSVVLLPLTALLVSSCSELGDGVTEPQPRVLSVHPAGWANPASPEFHGLEIRSMDWRMQSCQECHGSDFAGGIVDVSCLTCHPNTPEACNTCHGSRTTGSPAPPPDIDGNTSTTAVGVGAHTQHLQEGPLSLGFACTTCHVVPDSVYQAGHLDVSPQEIVMFSGLATANMAQPVWDGATCANTYCHGGKPGQRAGLDGRKRYPGRLWNLSRVAATCPAPAGGRMSSVSFQCRGCQLEHHRQGETRQWHVGFLALASDRNYNTGG
jgi:hypothetical protein